MARYVALIPFLPDSVSFAGICDLWSTSDVSNVLNVEGIFIFLYVMQHPGSPCFWWEFRLDELLRSLPT